LFIFKDLPFKIECFSRKIINENTENPFVSVREILKIVFFEMSNIAERAVVKAGQLRNSVFWNILKFYFLLIAPSFFHGN